jgi:hypothetical protein
MERDVINMAKLFEMADSTGSEIEALSLRNK